MSNKTIDSILDSGPSENTSNFNAHDDHSSRASSGMVCTKCGAAKVSYSRLQPFDDFKMRFIAKRPYRCLHCYHRFWLAEKNTSNPKRTWIVVTILLLLLIILSLLSLGVFNAPQLGQRSDVVVPEFNSPELPDDSSPSLASLINMPQGNSGSQVSSDVQANVQVASNSPLVLESTVGELLTPEQKARRLLLAKQESEVAEKASQARVEQLERVLLPVEDELESLVKIEVGYVVERWREAWSKGDVDTYLLSYSTDFTPVNDLTLDAWVASRKRRVKPEKNISVELNDFDITMLEETGSGIVEFNQRYQSGDYVESSRKRLELVKEQDSWKIISEVELK